MKEDLRDRADVKAILINTTKKLRALEAKLQITLDCGEPGDACYMTGGPPSCVKHLTRRVEKAEALLETSTKNLESEIAHLKAENRKFRLRKITLGQRIFEFWHPWAKPEASEREE